MIDFSNLLQPISAEFPCGRDLREDDTFHSLYFQIKEERFTARTIERNLGEDSAEAQWKKIYDLSITILTEQSKDTQVICWFIESVLRLKGFEGLNSALQVTYDLIEQYWDQLFPQPTLEDEEAKCAPFYGLNGEGSEGTLIFPVLNASLTQPVSVSAFSTWQYKEIEKIKKITDLQQKEEKLAALNFTLENVETAIKETSNSFFDDLFEHINNSLKNLKKIGEILSDKESEKAPSFRDIIKALQGCLDTLSQFYVKSEDSQISSISQKPSESIQITNEQSSNIVEREKALKELKKIADFFKQSEPHSPIPYLLDKAIKWGKISLQQLLEELIDDENVLKDIFRLTGIEVDSKS